MNQSTSLPIIICGYRGKMGQAVSETIVNSDDCHLIAQVGRGDSLANTLAQHPGAIVIDFTHPGVVFEHLNCILAHHCHPIIGSSGLTNEQIKSCQAIANKKRIGGIIAANFSLAANLMMYFSAMAAPFFQTIDIVETHHTEKKDAPAATAIKTAQMMHDARSTHPDPKAFKPRQLTSIHQVNDIPIQALRVAGRIADQEVIFGNLDEQLTINYHCTDRNAFMQGILFACRQVKQLHQLHEGLTELLLPTIMKHARSMCS